MTADAGPPADVLIDTSAWTQFLRRRGDPAVRARVSQLVLDRRAVWCDIVRLELWHGVRNDWDRELLRSTEANVRSLAITETAWDIACDLGAFARGRGLNVPAADLVVFACARVHRAGLEHNDQHFARMADLFGQARVPSRLSR